MRGKALVIGLTATAAVVLGCHHDKQNVSYTPKEGVFLPTDEARFNNPPSAEYRKRPTAKDEKTLMGGGNNKMANGPGF